MSENISGSSVASSGVSDSGSTGTPAEASGGEGTADGLGLSGSPAPVASEGSGEGVPAGTAGGAQTAGTASSEVEETFTVNGKPYKVKIPSNTPDEVKKIIQKGLASDEAFQSAAETRKQVERITAALKSKEHIFDVLKAVGHDPDALVREYVEARAAEEQMTPDQKEMARIRKERDEYAQYKAKYEAHEQEQERARLTTEYKAQYTKLVDDTLASDPVLKVDPLGRRAVLGVLSMAMEAGQNVDADTLRKLSLERLSKERSVLREYSPETLAEILGEDGLKKLREMELAKLKAPNAGETQPATAKAPEKKKGPMSSKEWDKMIAERYTRLGKEKFE